MSVMTVSIFNCPMQTCCMLGRRHARGIIITWRRKMSILHLLLRKLNAPNLKSLSSLYTFRPTDWKLRNRLVTGKKLVIGMWFRHRFHGQIGYWSGPLSVVRLSRESATRARPFRMVFLYTVLTVSILTVRWPAWRLCSRIGAHNLTSGFLRFCMGDLSSLRTKGV